MTPKVDISDLEETLTVTEIAQICKVRRESVSRWIRQGRLRAIRPPTGKPLRVRREDFEGFLDGYSFTQE